MTIVNAFRKKRVKKLLEQAYVLINERSFDKALRIAEQLIHLRNSGGFEITDMAHAG